MPTDDRGATTAGRAAPLPPLSPVPCPLFPDPCPLSSRAPAGRPVQEAQENPPLPHADALGAPHGIADPPPATALANVESCLATCCPPHFGLETTSLSKLVLYNGIATLP